MVPWEMRAPLPLPLFGEGWEWTIRVGFEIRATHDQQETRVNHDRKGW